MLFFHTARIITAVFKTLVFQEPDFVLIKKSRHECSTKQHRKKGIGNQFLNNF